MAPQSVTLNALGEQRRLLTVVRFRNRFPASLEDIPWNALLAEKIQQFGSCRAVNPISELTGPVIDFPDAQFPDHVNLRASRRRENV